VRRIPALIAIFATALNALWPLIAQAQPKDPLLVAVICSGEGGAHALDLTKKPGGGTAGDHGHCTLCTLGAGLSTNTQASIHAVPIGSAGLVQLPATPFQSASSLPAPARGPPPVL